MLTLVQVRTDKTYSGIINFEPLNKSEKLKTLFSEKYTNKLLKMYANNDRLLNRVSLMTVNYNDGEKLAFFSLLPIGAAHAAPSCVEWKIIQSS